MHVGDPRPLTAEPLSLDLVNTEWMERGQRHDLLAERAGVRLWLASVGLADSPSDAPARAALLEARRCLRAVLERPEDRRARDAVNAVLAHGRVRSRLREGGPEDVVEVADPSWRAAWVAVDDYLRLLRAGPERVRACAHPDCILYFFDTSGNGGRRWCSMATCGNRAKAKRHYARVQRPSQE